jgi:hypothetical protein
VTADFKAVAEDFLEAADPNYEVTSAVANATLGVYSTAKSIEEITYMGEVAKATCDDIAVQVKLKVEMMQVLMSLIFAWEHSKRKIREGGEGMAKFAQSMVLTRRQTRRYYKFMAEDMVITWYVIASTPFYRISLLNPQGLDELWRIKKVMHPDNLKATEYVLFEEILSEKTMQEILLTPQPYPYYELPDSNIYPAIDAEYGVLAEELNQSIRYFQRNRRSVPSSNDELLNNSRTLTLEIANSTEKNGGQKSSATSQNSFSGSSQKIPAEMKTGLGKSFAKSAAKEVAKEAGKGLLRGLFGR